MLTLAQIDQKYLIWRQPRWTREYYELRAGKDVIGSLGMRKWFSDQAEVNTTSGTWIFDRTGFFRSGGIVYERDKQVEIASFEYDWVKDCQIYMHDGQSFKWFRTKVLETAWIMASAKDQPLFELVLGTHWFKREGRVTLGVNPDTLPNLDLLICLGFYLGYCALNDTAAVVAATTSVTAAIV